jgi:hypothetical protein
MHKVWIITNSFKEVISTGVARLGNVTFRIALFRSDSNIGTCINNYSELTNETKSENGYIKGGQVIKTILQLKNKLHWKHWWHPLLVKEISLSLEDDVIWTAYGGNICFNWFVLLNDKDEVLFFQDLGNICLTEYNSLIIKKHTIFTLEDRSYDMNKQQLIAFLGIIGGFLVSVGFALWYLISKGEFKFKKPS